MFRLRFSDPSLFHHHVCSKIDRLLPRTLEKSWSSSSAANLKDYATVSKPIDICTGKINCNLPTSAKVEVFEKNKHQEEASNVVKPCDDGSLNLRAGMVLLKNYMTLDEQVTTVSECRRLGLGPGGFYNVNPRLMLMCLGLDWDPKTSKYNKVRRFDRARVPSIPSGFLDMVDRAILASRVCTEKKYGPRIVQDLVPMVSPDVCLLNFYTEAGRLGLHQDKDESKMSLEKGIPIVSFSIGDAGEFSYGDHRDVREAKKVMLESGDVLVFGGPARHVFHGVQSIIPRSAPESLIRETGLRPGRLNLTFRQF